MTGWERSSRCVPCGTGELSTLLTVGLAGKRAHKIITCSRALLYQIPSQSKPIKVAYFCASVHSLIFAFNAHMLPLATHPCSTTGTMITSSSTVQDKLSCITI
jgi:hypothetical protein